MDVTPRPKAPVRRPGRETADEIRLRRMVVAATPWCLTGEKIRTIDPRFDACGGPWRRPTVHAHHRRRRSQGGAYSWDNLLAVCDHCHAWIHDHPVMARALALLVFRGDPEWIELAVAAL